MDKPQIDFIIFDLDGTLLDSVPDLAWAADQAVQAMGFPSVSLDEVRHWIGNGADILIGRALSRSIDIDPSLSEALRQKARVCFDDFYFQSQHKRSFLYDDVKETLAEFHARGIKMAIVTNKPAKFVPHLLEVHGLDAYFVDVVGGDTFPLRKPDPFALHWLMEKHSLDSTHTMMVGDSRNDVLAGKAAGCFVAGLTYGYNYGESIASCEPNVVLDHFRDLLNVIK